MNLVQSKLNDLMHEQWSNGVHNKPKLRTYVQIKDTFEPEPYVLSNISRQRRSLFTVRRLLMVIAVTINTRWWPLQGRITYRPVATKPVPLKLIYLLGQMRIWCVQHVALEFLFQMIPFRSNSRRKILPC